MSMYRQIVECVRQRTGLTVHRTAWIAQIKRELPLPVGTAWNSGHGAGAGPCPSRLREPILYCLQNHDHEA